MHLQRICHFQECLSGSLFSRLDCEMGFCPVKTDPSYRRFFRSGKRNIVAGKGRPVESYGSVWNRSDCSQRDCSEHLEPDCSLFHCDGNCLYHGNRTVHGNQDIDAAKYCFRKLLRIALALSSGWNLIILILTPLYLQF